jgi:hypothetical protein
MKDHQHEHILEKPSGGLVGTTVESKVSVRKLVEMMETETSNLEEMAIEFKESGGRVVDVSGKQFEIEVSSGSFRLNRYYVRRA